MPPEHMTVITIDGPAGAGKSTVAKALARHLRFSYLDTGAMYRALTWKALQEKVGLEKEDDLVALARRTQIDLKGEPDGLKVVVDGHDVTEAIRSLEVTNNTFYVARAPQVREIMVQWQRDYAKRANIVVEGRDVGTVVFPQARYKFYLDADFEQRCTRRIKELKEGGKTVEEERLKTELKDRDHKDTTRGTGPLKKAADAVLIDSTDLSVEGVVAKIVATMKN